MGFIRHQDNKGYYHSDTPPSPVENPDSGKRKIPEVLVLTPFNPSCEITFPSTFPKINASGLLIQKGMEHSNIM